jgi:hypothetical protein
VSHAKHTSSGLTGSVTQMFAADPFRLKASWHAGTSRSNICNHTDGEEYL